MTDSLLFPWSGDRLDDSTGAPQNASYFEVYDAGTLDQRDVYTDSDLTDGAAWPITADGGGLCPARYLGVGAYKVIAKKSDGTTLWTLDDLPGALDTSGFGGSGTAAPRTPVSVVALSRSITSADFGKVLSVNPTSGDVILPFPDPAGITNGDGLTVTHTGTANAGVLTFSGQDPYILAEPGEAVRIVCTAAAYLMVSDKSATAPTWYPRITDRLTTAPSSPTTGAYYLINGTPTGTWSTLGFQEHDLVRYDGDGSYILYRPTTDCMWLGTIVDEDLLVQFRGSAWVDLPNVSAPQSDDLDVLSLYYDGTSTNTIAATTWTKVPAYTTAKNTITGASHSAGAITLPVGNYLVLGFPGLVTTTGTNVARARLYSTTNTTTKITSINWKNTVPVSADAGACPVVIGHLAVTSAEVFELQVWSNTSTTIFGAADSSSEAEKFATIEFISIASQQGPIGEQGPQGTDGLDAAHALQWSTSTGDPGTGKIGVNNANPTLATVVNISETGSDSGLLADILATWDDSTSSVRGIIKISKEGSTQHFYYYHLTGAQTNNGTYRSFPATFIGPASGTSLSNGDSCAVLFVPKGDKGDTGATGSAATASFDYTFSTTTTSGPSTGTIRANNATLSSATALYIHETDRLGIPQASAIAQWDDSTTTAHRGYLTLIDVATPANKVRFEITGANTDNGSDQTITVTYVSGATSLTAVNVQVIWERTGDKGADGSGDFSGPSSATDNAIVRFDGTTGKLGQNSTVTISAAGTIAGASVLAAGTSTTRTLEARFADTLNVEDFGAVGDGSTNSTAAFVAAIAALPTSGGTIFVPAGVYMVDPDQMVIGNGTNAAISSRNGVAMVGEAATPYLSTSGTVIKARSSGTALLKLAGSVHGLRIENILFDCDGVCARGWEVYSINNCSFRNFGIIDFTAYGILADCRTYGPGSVGWASNNVFEQFYITSSVVADYGAGIQIGGYFSGNYDWFRNEFRVGVIEVNKGTTNPTAALWLKFCDSCQFFDVDANAVGGVTGYSAIFDGSANSLYPQNMFFFQCSFEAGTLVSGTISKNYFFGFPTRDSEPIPSDANLIGFTDQGQFFGAHSFADVSVSGGVLTLPNTGLHILDTNASHDLIVAPGSNLTADRTLTITTGDASRTLTISADVTLTTAALKQHPDSTTDNTIARFDGTSGDLQSSGVVIDDNNCVGIGTAPASANDKLHVKGTALRFEGTSVPSNNYGWFLHNASATLDYGLSLEHYNGSVRDAHIAIGGNGGTGNVGVISFQTHGSSSSVERMKIDADGQAIFSPGSATPATLSANGQFTITPTSNTNIRLSYRGSDGTTRVANITLA